MNRGCGKIEDINFIKVIRVNIILLSGGSGKRLWPLSNDIRSKQFIKIFKNEDGAYESMVQRIYRQIQSVDSSAKVTIATSKTQVSALNNQLGDAIGISVEPCRRDTFPAIALATAYLRDVQNISEEEAVVVCPVDPYVNRDYFEAIKRLWELAQKGGSNLTLMGIDPIYPSEKYGYIMPISKDEISKVKSFKEKPDAETAEKYIRQGALWNGGVFAYQLKYVLAICKKILGTSDYHELFSDYENLKKISFDYAVVEKESDITVMRFAGQWDDLGTWNALSEAMQEPSIGNGIISRQCENTNVVNELNIPILCLGLENIVVAASQDGILVSDKKMSSNIKPLVDKLNQEIRFAEKSWGDYRVLDVSEKSMTIKVTIKPGHRMSYHSHGLRDEVWTIMAGTGHTIVDGMEQIVEPGDVITIQAGCRHTIVADSNKLELIEVQLGEEISAADKQKFELEF